MHLWKDCYISQNHDNHIKKNRWWVYAIDISCRARYFDVYAPWTWYYKVEAWYNTILWDYVILKKWNTMLVFWHTTWNRDENVRWWEKIWSINIKWVTTAPHLHFEIRENNRNVNIHGVINPNDDILKAQRWREKVYFTRYDLWDVSQNDASPCIWASWKDLCKMQREWKKTIALTSDIRKVHWIRFWDTVKLVWDVGCSWTFTVEDEMNKRFREQCIKRKWTNYCIKWDMQQQGWACYVVKM